MSEPEDIKPEDVINEGESLRLPDDEQLDGGLIRRDGRQWHRIRQNSRGEWVYMEVRPRR